MGKGTKGKTFIDELKRIEHDALRVREVEARRVSKELRAAARPQAKKLIKEIRALAEKDAVRWQSHKIQVGEFKDQSDPVIDLVLVWARKQGLKARLGYYDVRYDYDYDISLRGYLRPPHYYLELSW